MKAIASVAFGILSSVGACVAAASVASYVVADSEPHAFKELAARELWTTTPVKVDPRQQQEDRQYKTVPGTLPIPSSLHH